MSSIAALSALERRDAPLESALATVTEGRLQTPNTLQFALFPRLMTQDTGLLIPTGPGAGRLEAVFIPFMMNVQPRDFAHRLYIIAADGSPLDDYLFRLGPYLRCLVAMDGTARTIWLEEPERTPIARRYLSDGTIQNGAADHPFSQGVDVVVMPFSHFRALFFGTGGVHAVPEVIGFDRAMASEMKPRGLFYFDDSFGPSRDEQLEFVRMVEFLFAQDLDVIVGSSSMSLSLQDELAFLELLSMSETQYQPNRRIQQVDPFGSLIEQMVATAIRVAESSLHTAVVLNDPNDPRLGDIYENLSQKGRDVPLIYRSSASRAERIPVYAELKRRHHAGESFILVVDGPALEASDLDFSVLISEQCHPLNMVRRAGRCNRYGDRSIGTIYILGETDAFLDEESSVMSGFARQSYKELLATTRQGTIFNSDAWISASV